MVIRARWIVTAFKFVSLREMIMHQRIIWIEFEDALVFRDRFLRAA